MAHFLHTCYIFWRMRFEKIGFPDSIERRNVLNSIAQVVSKNELYCWTADQKLCIYYCIPSKHFTTVNNFKDMALSIVN